MIVEIPLLSARFKKVRITQSLSPPLSSHIVTKTPLQLQKAYTFNEYVLLSGIPRNVSQWMQ
jgi:hypothetical protein